MNTLSLVLALESVTYSPPSSPKAQMADFYVLAWMGSISPDGLVKAGTVSALRMDLEDVRHAESVLYPKLRTRFLSDVFRALCSEFRHVFDLEQDTSSRLLQAYRRASGPGKSGDDHGVMVQALSDIGMDQQDAVVEMGKLFRHGQWNRLYGGEAWARIASGWLLLDRSTTLRRMAVAIDHIYDLQHNTGSIFNKLPEYADTDSFGSEYAWIKKALDYKSSVGNIRRLLPWCSSQMRRMALPVLKAAAVPEPEPEDPTPGPAPTPHRRRPKKLVGGPPVDLSGAKWVPSSKYPDSIFLVDGTGATLGILIQRAAWQGGGWGAVVGGRSRGAFDTLDKAKAAMEQNVASGAWTGMAQR